MQKLSVELKNTPANAPQVYCSVNPQLNKDQSLSVEDKVLADNNLDVDQSQHTGRSIKPSVYVISKQGKPLMPCTPAKAKNLLKKGGATVLKRFPFTIQLKFDCEEKTQDVVLGIDSGYSNIGFSAISPKTELVSGEVKLENKMSDRISDKAMYRRHRRNRLWYRQPRFNNRVSSKKSGWLPPSTKRRYETHLNLIKQIKSILPVSEVIIEAARFDMQKLENPEIEGTGYQHGTMYGYRNKIGYLLAREKGVCQYCSKPYKQGDPWRLHHIWGRHKDRSEHWALLHESCHKKLHDRGDEKVLRNKKVKSYKDSTFMNIIRQKFKDKGFKLTFGNITFQNRIDLGIEKSHCNDAFVIAGGKGQTRSKPIEVIQKRRCNRSLQKNRKGFTPSIRKQRYSIQPKDLVLLGNIWKETSGVHCKGNRIVVEGKSISIKKILGVYHSKSLIWRSAQAGVLSSHD